MIRVLIADDDALVRSALRAIVDAEPDLTVVGESADGIAVVHDVERLRPEVVLMDVRMPGIDGIRATELVCRRPDAPAVVVVTTFENDDYVYDALQAGARGFLLKRAPAAAFGDAVRTVVRGDSLLSPEAVRALVAARPRGSGAADRLAAVRLTDRESEVLALMATGLSNAEIAERLYLGVETVKTHVRGVLAKLGARDRVQAVVLAHESGFASRR